MDGVNVSMTAEQQKQWEYFLSNHFVVYRPNSTKAVEVWALKWSDLIAMNRQKLTYLGNLLELKDKDIKRAIEEEFGDVPLLRLKSELNEPKPVKTTRTPARS
jgi:hypothetical protein